jgi:SAM-dependent methyltransferase
MRYFMSYTTLKRKFEEETNDSLARLFGVKIHRESVARPSTLKAKAMFGSAPVRALEIGCGHGKNARNICEELNVSELVVVDPHDKYADYKDYNREYLIWAREKAKQRLAKWERKVTWITELSDAALAHIQGTFDYIYVDGNHDFEYVLADMNNYYKLLKPKAVIGGHDIDQVGVTRAFARFVYENQIENCEIKNPDWIITRGA